MNITTIKHQPLTSKETLAFRNAEVLKKSDVSKTEVAPHTPKETKWQQNILLDVISDLENNLQPDNNHPLGRADYQPIENLQEALAQMPYFQTDAFKSTASQAQANLRPQDIAALFSDL